MEQTDLLDSLRNRRSLLLNFRWLLFLWLAATQAVYAGQPDSAGALVLLPLGLTLASQMVLWLLPLRQMEGLKVYYAVFVFDLMVILMNLELAGRLHQDLVIAFFLGIFLAALTRRVGASFFSALLLGAAYLALRNHVDPGATLRESGPLLDLPFLLIASIHSGLVAQEAEAETQSRRRLLADNGSLTRKLHSNFFESFRFNRDIKALLDTLPFAMVMLDRTRGVRFFNAGAEMAFGIRRESVVGSLLGDAPELASLNAAVGRQEERTDGGFEWVDVHPPEGDPIRMILGAYFVAPGDGTPVGTLLVLMPFPYYQSMDQFVGTLPLDERQPNTGFREAPSTPSTPPVPALASLSSLLPLPPLPA